MTSELRRNCVAALFTLVAVLAGTFVVMTVSHFLGG